MSEVLLSTALLTVLVTALTVVVFLVRDALLPSRPVKIMVNGNTEFDGRTGERLLPILKAGGMPIPSACAGAGTCGLCRVGVSSGAEAPLANELARLSRADVVNGVRLACQIVVREPMSVTVPDEFLSAETLSCEVVSSRMPAPLIREVVLRLPQAAQFVPRPGAFVQITAPPFSLDFEQLSLDAEYAEEWRRNGWSALGVHSDVAVTRAYSLANRPADAATIVLTVRIALPPPGRDDVQPGIVSSYLFGLAPGERVDVSGPYGDFAVRQSDREMVFIGGGVGMAPLRALIHQQLEVERTTRKMSYWYGARNAGDAFYCDEFRDLQRRYDNFDFHLALSEAEPGLEADVATGFVHEVAWRSYLKDHPAPQDCEYYLCGPPLMIQAVRAMLDNLGVEEEMIEFDDFGA